MHVIKQSVHFYTAIKTTHNIWFYFYASFTPLFISKHTPASNVKMNLWVTYWVITKIE